MEIKTYLKLIALIVLHIAIVFAFINPMTTFALCTIYLCCALSDINIG